MIYTYGYGLAATILSTEPATNHLAMLAGNGKMRLTYATTAFTHQGVSMPGVPVLLTDNLAIVEAPQRRLFYIVPDRGRTRSRATWRS